MEDEEESIAEENEQCRCRYIEKNILDRVSRKNRGSAGMKGNDMCIATLKTFIGAGHDLEHVCFRHLQAIAGHIGFQIKKLSAADLRVRLCEFWEHRQDIDAFKTSGSTQNWWRLQDRPWVADDDHGVYAKRAARSELIQPLSDDMVTSSITPYMFVAAQTGAGASSPTHTMPSTHQATSRSFGILI